ncbi:MAG: hypothetical protein ABI360_00170 [Allobranchiibius sp.]
MRFSSVLATTVWPILLPAPLHHGALRASRVDARTASNRVAQFADIVRDGHYFAPSVALLP